MIETPRENQRSGVGAEPRVAVPFRCDAVFFDEHAVISVRGEIDLATAAELTREASAVLALPIVAIEIDLEAVTFLDSSGLNALLRLREYAQERSVSFTLVSVPRIVARVIEVTGLRETFELPPEGQLTS